MGKKTKRRWDAESSIRLLIELTEENAVLKETCDGLRAESEARGREEEERRRAAEEQARELQLLRDENERLKKECEELRLRPTADVRATEARLTDVRSADVLWAIKQSLDALSTAVSGGAKADGGKHGE